MKNVNPNVTDELVVELRKLFDDDEFVDGTLFYADTDEDRQTILDFIRAGENVSVETVCLLSLDLDIARNGPYNDRVYDD